MANEERALLEQQERLAVEMRALLDKAEGEKRGLNTEEDSSYQRLEKEIGEIGDKLEKIAQLRDIGDKRESLEKRLVRGFAGKEVSIRDDFNKHPTNQREYRAAFRKFLSADGLEAIEATRGLIVGSADKGGFLVPQELVLTEILEPLRSLSIVRSLSRIFSVGKATSLGVPTIESGMQDPEWSSELGAPNDNDTITFGKRSLSPHHAKTSTVLSRDFVRNAITDPEAMIFDHLNYRFSIMEDKFFLLGNGQSQPLGLLTPSSSGISTNRDFVCGSATAPTVDKCIDCVFELKEGYLSNATWLVSRAFKKALMKLKDGEGRYLWKPGVEGGAPSTFLDYPIRTNDFVPAVFTTGSYVGIFGDFRFYWVVDALELSIQRLEEMRARTNQYEYIADKSTDGMPVMEEAFVRLKLG